MAYALKLALTHTLIIFNIFYLTIKYMPNWPKLAMIIFSLYMRKEQSHFRGRK